MNNCEQGASGSNAEPQVGTSGAVNESDQRVNKFGVAFDDFWIWKKVLLRIKINIDKLDKRLAVNSAIHNDVQRTMNKFQRLREQQPNQENEPEDLQDILALMSKALNSLDDLALNLTGHSKDFNHIRRSLKLLEERLNRDNKDEELGAADKDRENAMKIALEYMSHVDDILERISSWEVHD